MTSGRLLKGRKAQLNIREIKVSLAICDKFERGIGLSKSMLLLQTSLVLAVSQLQEQVALRSYSGFISKSH